MNELDMLLQGMTFDFFGTGKHKIEMETLLSSQNALLLDVRSRQEWESVQIRLENHISVLWIPIEDIPARCGEIPRDATVGLFCPAGVRSAIAYLYLRALGYEHVRIAPSSYDALTNLLLPGKLMKAIRERAAKSAGMQ